MKNIKVRVRLLSGNIVNVDAKIADDTRNDKDAIDDAVSDYLDSIGVRYQWFRIIPELPEECINRTGDANFQCFETGKCKNCSE